MVEEAQGEAHIPAEQPSPFQASRVPSSHADPRRPGDRPVPTPEGPRPAVGLTWRVRDRATFDALRRQGRRARRGVVGVTYLPADAGPPRLAYALGRKLGPAVVRNRVRRRLRAAAQELAASPSGLAPGAYLVTVSPRAAEASYSTLRDDLAAATAATVAGPSVPGGGRP